MYEHHYNTFDENVIIRRVLPYCICMYEVYGNYIYITEQFCAHSF